MAMEIPLWMGILKGTSLINGPFSIAMFDDLRVNHVKSRRYPWETSLSLRNFWPGFVTNLAPKWFLSPGRWYNTVDGWWLVPPNPHKPVKLSGEHGKHGPEEYTFFKWSPLTFYRTLIPTSYLASVASILAFHLAPASAPRDEEGQTGAAPLFKSTDPQIIIWEYPSGNLA